MKETILAISGKPGLYRLVARGNGNLIVESIDEQKRRITAGSRDRVTSLRDVSMYTMDDDKPLMEVFESIKEKYNGQPVDIHTSKADKAQLYAFLDEVLPDNDADRIYPGDVKKLIQWYNILVQAGYTDFLEANEEEEATAEAAPAE
ncbi:MAG: DUF5606 domain-containing protein [Bacteroidales bacterium]|nr:DUF5606 domain-containing protein [Bacteroidales bacterium]MDD7232945.1 DUF5606 domain-containing protein [Bacteroidales bacterium]MDY2704529.1 DUF5606 domain-containing protein [Alloprevotella sp.]MDY4739717.1 DUF5606 domain-containing protein [Alloprevotella sp.]